LILGAAGSEPLKLSLPYRLIPLGFHPEYGGLFSLPPTPSTLLHTLNRKRAKALSCQQVCSGRLEPPGAEVEVDSIG